MTETANSATRASSKASKGLPMQRLWSTEGVHPYDQVTWERRDVVQTNWKTGEVVFEQRNVEFPESWSVNASTIVTTKYFRGAVGTEQREWSLRQLIDRLVLTDVKAGKVKTVQGSEVTLTTMGGVKVDAANVVKTDIVADNGVIHVIDAVILPK